MTKPSFFARTTLGQPNYLLVAMACAFVLALVPRGASCALRSATTNIEAWLPAASSEVQDLQWFRRHFRGEQFAVVSWDGCTLGNDESLELLAKKLMTPAAGAGKESGSGSRWYSRVTTGPQVIRELMQTHVGVTYAEAIRRVEGALVGPPQRDAHGRPLGNDSRTTCLVVDFSSEALANGDNLREAVAGISRIAAAECGIDPEAMHMGGPPVDKAIIDAEGARTLLRLAPLAGLIGIAVCYWRLRDARLTAIVFAVGAACAALSLALVFYFGVFEVVAWGRPAPQWGVLDVIVVAMPATVYLLALSAALHAANYYLQIRREHGFAGAAERAARHGPRPALIAAGAAAAALAALAANEIVPLQKFGLFTAASILAMAVVVYSVVPLALHRFPPSDAAVKRRALPGRLATFTGSLVQMVSARPGISLALSAIFLIALGAGARQLDASVQILKLIDTDSELIRDYAWLEHHIGNLVPMEVVVAMPPERLRTGEEHAEEDGQQYRLTMLERVALLRQIERRLEAFPQISRAMSAATFAPPATSTGLGGANRSGDYAKNKALEFHRDRLMSGDYLRIEGELGDRRPAGRELWRLNARVAALTADGEPIDYAELLGQLQRSVEPVLLAQQQRDQIVRALHEQGKQLAGARVCVMFRAPQQAAAPPADVLEQALADLLKVSGVAPRGVTYFNLAVFERPERGSAAKDELYRNSALASLRKQDAVVLASAPSDPVARKIASQGVYVVNVAGVHGAWETAALSLTDDGGPRPIRAVITGMAPVVERTQNELAASLLVGLGWSAALAAVVVTLGFMSLASGALAMGPALLPLAAALGVMGWAGMKVDLTLAMAAGAAIGVALEGTIHFISWYRDGLSTGRGRRDAVIWAHDHSARTLVDAAIISTAGLVAFIGSAFAPLGQFGALIAVAQAAALAGNLLILPAILASPLGWFFAPVNIRRGDPLWPKLQLWWESLQPRRPGGAGAVLPLGNPPAAPHYTAPTAPGQRTTLPTSTDERRELVEGPHSALHAKLQGMRRPRTGDSAV